MTNAEIDKALAERVMGWHLDGLAWCDQHENLILSTEHVCADECPLCDVWAPTRNIAQAIEAAEKADMAWKIGKEVDGARYTAIVCKAGMYVDVEALHQACTSAMPIGARMKVGLEYANDGLDYSVLPRYLTGVAGTIKATDVTWASLEAFPGLSRPNYNWRELDAMLEDWEDAGITVDCLVLRCQHPLATKATYASRGGPLSSAPPKNQRMWDAWGRLCEALGLHLAGRGIAKQVESEADRLWAGSVDEYLRLLDIAYYAFKKTDPQAPVVLAGVSPGPILDDAPDDPTFAARVEALPEPQRAEFVRAIRFYERTLQEGAYDAAGLHSLYGASGIGPTVARMRSLMPEGREVWVDDAFPGPSVCWTPPGWNQPPKSEMDARLVALERNDPGAREALYAEQAEATQERILEAEAAGCARLYVGPLRRWPFFTGQPWQGLVDDECNKLPVCDVIRAAQ